MRHHSTRSFTAFTAGSLLALLPLTAAASDDSKDQAQANAGQSQAKTATDLPRNR